MSPPRRRSGAAAPGGAPLPTRPDVLRLLGGRPGGICHGERHIGWGELSAAVEACARWLGQRGVGAGQHVGVLAGNHLGFVVTTYAFWGLGAVVVPIAVRATAADAARLAAHARCAALVCDEARTEVARAAAAAAGIPAYVCGGAMPVGLRGLRRGRPRGARSPRLAAIAYTSGTTGAPKGVMLTHANFLWATLACAHARGDSAASVGACLSPLSHMPVLVSHLLCRVLMGGTAVLFERFDLGSVLEAVERFRITDLPLIGGMVFDVVQLGRVPARVRATVRRVSVGGAPTPMDAKRGLAEIFPEAEIIEAYGQTEATDGVTMARGRAVFERAGTVGRPNPHVAVAIRRPDRSLAPPGEEGEVVVGGPTVMAGYHRDRAATAAALRDGWLHTGDLGRQDADGYLFLTGRLKDLIITGGENVSPAEVEEALRAHPEVAEVAVVGTPHPRWGEQVTAVVVRRPGTRLDRDTLGAFAAARLAGFKRPRRIEFLDALPRNAARKVETGVLKALLAGGHLPRG